MGVFATRSPFRPNNLGLSSVKLEKIEFDQELGPILHISGADLMNGTPIYDIKTISSLCRQSSGCKGRIYGSYQRLSAAGGISGRTDKRNSNGDRERHFFEVLANDPRPRYQNRPDKVYGLAYGHKDIHFQVRDDILTVCDVTEFSSQKSFDKQNNV